MSKFDIEEYLNFLNKSIYRSMIMEVGVTPKPGLVDLDNSGSHKDMNFTVFRNSAQALNPYFYKILSKAKDISDGSKILLNLRELGKEAENAMYEATGQINTHKGMIFNLGLIGAVMIYLSKYYGRELVYDDIPEIQKLIKINSMPLDLELSHSKVLTNGIRQYQEYGVGGARGEALSGYDTVFQKALPYMVEIGSYNFDLNTRLVAVLLKLITVTEDTNLMKRGGIEGSNFLIEKSIELMDNYENEDKFLKGVKDLDTEAIKRNLSPGGSADLLCATIFCALVFHIIK